MAGKEKRKKNNRKKGKKINKRLLNNSTKGRRYFFVRSKIQVGKTKNKKILSVCLKCLKITRSKRKC